MRTIKRYSNRKLYDTKGKKYITLRGIAKLIEAGQDVEVIDNETGEDLTRVTFSQIIFEQQKRGTSTPLSFFTNMIRFGGNSPLELWRRSLHLSSNLFHMIEKEIERRLQELVEQGEMAEEQMRKLKAELMGSLQEGTRQKKGEREDTLLRWLNIPSNRDIEQLAKGIDNLTERLDELIEQRRGKNGRRE